MDCPSCGRSNASERMECEFCQALLVEVFASSESEDDAKTDPIQVIGGGADRSTDTDALLRAAHEIDEEDAAVEDEAPLQRLPRPLDFTGDLPRLFRFSDRYQILEKVGEGGMGRVYKALDLELDRPVALKTIRTEKGTSREVLERFKQELILARKITHKNVIRIYDLGESDGMKFFTMELVEGEKPARGARQEKEDSRQRMPLADGADSERPRRSAPPGRRAPRFETAEHHGASRGRGAHHGFRHRPHCRLRNDDGHRRDDGNARLHLPRAGERRHCRREIQTSMLAV